jgi:hypothetical protein
MNKRLNALRAIAGIAFLLAGAKAPAQEAEATVELPPFVVTETTAGPPWRYARVEGFEILTQGSDRETREVFAALWRGRQMILPAALLPRFSVPMTVVLLDQPPARPTALRTLGSVRGENELTTHWTNLIKRTASERESFSLNLWRANFKYSVSFRFDAFTLLKRRTPPAPTWLTEGLFGRYGLYREGWAWRPGDEFMRVLPARWFSPEETEQARRYHEATAARAGNVAGAIAGELGLFELVAMIPEMPAVLGIPAGAEPPAGAGKSTGRKPALEPAPASHVQADAPLVLPKMSVTSDFAERWESAAALFVRWGIYGRTPADAEKFWRFAERACVEPVTEELFEECIGMSFSEVRLALARYLPAAVVRFASTPTGKIETPPVLKLRLATDEEIARLRGEWERLEALTLGVRFPEIAQKYREQAARRFDLIHKRGGRDPRLLASMGLLALDGRDPVRARDLLEAAASKRVAGPIVYFELARLRWSAAEAQGTDALTAELIAGVVELLLLGEQQSPAVPAIYGFLAEITLQTRNGSLGQVPALRRGLDHFPKTPAVRTRLEAALKLVDNQNR